MQGIGYQVTDGDEYKGEFFCDLRHGKGVLKVNGQPAKSCVFKNGVKVKEIPESLEYIMEKFTKNKIDKFFEFFQHEIQQVEESLAANRRNFKIDFAKVQQDFGQENKSLEGTINAQRREIKRMISEFLTQKAQHESIKSRNELSPQISGDNKNWRYFDSQNDILQNVTQSRLDISPEISTKDYGKRGANKNYPENKSKE